MEDFHFTTRALSHPEILRRIITQLTNPSLARAARVARSWFAPATDALWQYGSLAHLQRVKPDKRRQQYASKMTDLAVENKHRSWDYTIARKLKFEKITSASFIDYLADQDRLCKSCQPFKSSPVNEVTIMDSIVHDAFFECIAELWPNISKIYIGTLFPSEITQQAFLDFVKSRPSLESLDVQEGEDDLQGQDLFPHCATRAELTALRLPFDISTEVVQKTIAQEGNLFPSLKSLFITMPSDAFSLLLGPFRNLTDLEIEVTDVTTAILSDISSITALERLVVILPCNYDLPKKEILSLRSLTKMRDLYLNRDGLDGDVMEAEDLEQLDFIDADFEELVSHFPGLCSLTFLCECTLTARALLSLADHCPRLGSVTLPSDVDLYGLGLDTRKKVLFPELWSLRLESLYTSQYTGEVVGTDFEHLSKRIGEHFPKLTDMAIKDTERGFADLASSFAPSVKSHRRRVREKVASDLELTEVKGPWIGSVCEMEDDEAYGFDTEEEDPSEDDEYYRYGAEDIDYEEDDESDDSVSITGPVSSTMPGGDVQLGGLTDSDDSSSSWEDVEEE